MKQVFKKINKILKKRRKIQGNEERKKSSKKNGTEIKPNKN